MANKPKMDFLLNIPTVVTLGNNFKNGQGEYGPWFGWGVIEQGVEKTLFADTGLQAFLSQYGKGADVSITKSQIPGSKQFAWHVAPVSAAYAQPSAPVAPQQQQPPPLAPQASQRPNTAQQSANGTWDREEYRAERIARAEEAVNDAEKVLNDPSAWSREDVRALAISFLIDEQHKGIAPPETAKF